MAHEAPKRVQPGFKEIDLTKFREDPQLGGYYPYASWQAQTLGKLFGFMLRHDLDAPGDSAGRVPFTYLMDKVKKRHDGLQHATRQQVLITLVGNHRFRFFGTSTRELNSCEYMSAAQGHTKENVNLHEAAKLMAFNDLPWVIVHLTNYRNLVSILRQGLVPGLSHIHI